MKKKLVSVLLAALTVTALPLFSLTGCNSASELGEEEMLIPTQPLEQQDLMNFISTTGTVEGSNTVHVTTELTAKVATLNVELGSEVKVGDVLCTFDTTELQKQYDTLKKSSDRMNAQRERANEKQQQMLQDAKLSKSEMLEKAQKMVDRAQIQKDAAQNNLSSMEARLKEIGEAIENFEFSEDDPEAGSIYNDFIEQYNTIGESITEMQNSMAEFDAALEDAKSAYRETERAAQDNIDAAREAIEDAQLEVEDEFTEQLEELKEQIDSAVIKADRNGVVTALNIAEGSIPTSTTLMTIEDTNILRINVQISETDILDVHEGQLATIRTTATGDTEFTGKVSRVVNIYSANSNDMYGYGYGEPIGGYSAEITLDGTGNQLLIGMNAKAKIVLEEKESVFAVPYDAIGETEDGENCIYIAEESGDAYTVRCITVEKGMEANFMTEVSGKELEEGALVITDISSVSEGDTIQITEGYQDYMDDADAMNADF